MTKAETATAETAPVANKQREATLLEYQQFVNNLTANLAGMASVMGLDEVSPGDGVANGMPTILGFVLRFGPDVQDLPISLTINVTP